MSPSPPPSRRALYTRDLEDERDNLLVENRRLEDLISALDHENEHLKDELIGAQRQTISCLVAILRAGGGGDGIHQRD